jgi:SAM-dependent methyltransferase
MADAGTNAEQREYWNADEARHWVHEQDSYDRMLAPFSTRLLDAAAIASGDSVIDIGCGTGATTCAAAGAAAEGRALGLDISRAMVEAARARASREQITNVTFEVGDAQTRRFESGRADVVMSRFGVMFFDDATTAFANIGTALRPAGRLVFVCWQPLFDNEWMAVPGLAAAQHVPLPDPGPPDAPGPFSLGDPDRIRSVLDGAGYRDVVIDPLDDAILLGGGGTVDDTIRFLRGTGMARVLLADAKPEAVEAAVESIRDALTPFASPDGVRLGAAVWLVQASR